MTESTEILIRRLVRRRKVDSVTKCWNWTGCLAGKGYGKIKFKLFGYYDYYYVHRLIAYLCLGFDINSKLHVLHKCDNMKCFNPLHLFIGTNEQNIEDSISKGRQPLKGINHSKHILKNVA